MTLNKTIIAYTAGILDGEGSIQINPSKNYQNPFGKKYWSLTVQISSNNLKVLNYLQKNWNIGFITKWKARGAKLGRSSYNWRIYSKHAQKLLTILYPFLIIKKSQAKIGLKFIKYVGYKRNRITGKISKIRNNLAFKMKELNDKNGKGNIKNFHKGII